MTDTAELIAELKRRAHEKSARNSLIEPDQTIYWIAAIALAAQAQELTQERARNHAFMADAERFENRAEAAEARVRELLAEKTTDHAQISRLEAERDTIEAKTFAETRERCAEVADRIDSVNGTGEKIRALNKS